MYLRYIIIGSYSENGRTVDRSIWNPKIPGTSKTNVKPSRQKQQQQKVPMSVILDMIKVDSAFVTYYVHSMSPKSSISYIFFLVEAHWCTWAELISYFIDSTDWLNLTKFDEHTRTQAHTYAYARTRTYAYAHTYVRTQECIHTPTRRSVWE